MQILLVEDDALLADGLVKALKREGFAVNHVSDGKSALHSFKSEKPDIVVLDLGLPDMDGVDVLRQMRTQPCTTSILILTARDDTQSKILGLDGGADDYITKPFDPEELMARLRVLGRRLGNQTTSKIVIGAVSLDTTSHNVMVNGETVDLPRREYMVLKALMEHQGAIKTRENIESKLYSWGDEIASNAIEVHISNLRKKLPPDFIKTVRGVGYVIKKKNNSA